MLPTERNSKMAVQYMVCIYCSGAFWKEKEFIIWIYKNRKFIEYFQLKSSCHISNALLFIEGSIIVSTVLIFVLETHTRGP